MFKQKEFELLNKYRKRESVNPGDLDDMNDLESIGLLRMRMETAVLTPLGQSILQEEKIRRNPILRFFSAVINSSM